MARQEARYNSIFESTCATVFMGVPHDGADIAQLAKRVGTIAQAYFDLNATNLKELVRNCRSIQSIARAFGEIQGFSVVTITESEKTAMPNRKSVIVSVKTFGNVLCCVKHSSDLQKVVPSASARLNLGDREKTFSITGADHRTLCRFPAVDDSQYRKVAATLQELVKSQNIEHSSMWYK